MEWCCTKVTYVSETYSAALAKFKEKLSSEEMLSSVQIHFRYRTNQRKRCLQLEKERIEELEYALRKDGADESR